MAEGKKQLTWGVLSAPEFKTRMYFKNDNGGRRRRRRCVVQAIDVFRNSGNFVMVFLWDGVGHAMAVLPRRLEMICDWKCLQNRSIIEIKRYGFNADGTIVLEDIEILQWQSPILFSRNPNQNFGDYIVHVSSADLFPPRQSSRLCNRHSCSACSKPENIYQSSSYDFGYPIDLMAAAEKMAALSMLTNNKEMKQNYRNLEDKFQLLQKELDDCLEYSSSKCITNQEIYTCDMAGENTIVEGDGTIDFMVAAEKMGALSRLSNNKEMNYYYRNLQDKFQLLQKEFDDSLEDSSSKDIINQEIYLCDIVEQIAIEESDCTIDLMAAAEKMAALSLLSNNKEMNQNCINLHDKFQLLQKELDDSLSSSSKGVTYQKIYPCDMARNDAAIRGDGTINSRNLDERFMLMQKKLNDYLASLSKEEIYPCDIAACDMAGEDAAARGDGTIDFMVATVAVAKMADLSLLLNNKEMNEDYINLENRVMFMQKKLNDYLASL